MKQITTAVLFFFVLLSNSAATFVSFGNHRPFSNPFLFAAIPKVPKESAFPETVDLKRAHECADHLGECTLQEIEEIKSALHAERLAHVADEMAGYIVKSDPADEVDRLVLEEQLSKQSHLLKEAMLKAGDFLGSPPEAMDDAIAMDRPALGQHQEHETTISPVENPVIDQIKSVSFLESEVTETIMMCIAVAALIALPQFLHP